MQEEVAALEDTGVALAIVLFVRELPVMAAAMNLVAAIARLATSAP